MSSKQAASQRIEAVRKKTITILENVVDKNKRFQLPAPPKALETHHQKLLENNYNILVVGEAKRGKSTFVNALIGQDLLPTDVDISTSQVFRVSQAPRPAYRLRFEDDSVQEITADDLSRYGSQVVADAQNIPRLDQMIRWIEVEVPVRFIPKGIALLDTPGLGSLYAAHAQITHRFVPHADAVIFVLDSKSPIGQSEIEFIETILGVTNQIFFIQTMIDLYYETEWQDIQKRNQDILAERFGDRLADVRVWPIASTMLHEAAQTGDEDFLLISHYREMAKALQAFLRRVGGWLRAAEAIVVAERTHAMGEQMLKQRLADLQTKSKQESQKSIAQRKQEFEAKWGKRGQKRQELQSEVRRYAEIGQRSFRQALQPGNEIDLSQRKRIEGLQSLDEARQLGEVMAADVVIATSKKWQEICQQAQAECVTLLAPFLQDANAITLPSEALKNLTPDPDSGANIEYTSLLTYIKRIRSDIMSSSVIGTILSAPLFILGFEPITFVFVTIPVGLWSIAHSLDSVKLQELKAAQQELERHLVRTLQKIRNHYLNVDAGRLSFPEEYFKNLVDTVSEHIEKIATQKSLEARAEIERMSKGGQLHGQQRQARIKQLRQQIREWQTVGRSIQVLVKQLKALEPALAVR